MKPFKMKCKILLVFIAVCFFNSAMCQIVNVESKRIQSDSDRFVMNGDFNYKVLKNNNLRFRTYSGAVTTQFKSRSLKDTYLILASQDLTRLNEEIISKNWLVHTRYTRTISELFKLEVFTQAQQNRVLGIEIRQLNGLGPRIKVFGTKRLTTYSGTLYMLEYQKFFGADEQLTVKHRISTYLSVQASFPNGVGELTSVTYYQPRLSDFSDRRISNQTSLTFNITSKIAFINSLNLIFDSRPAKNISTFNFMVDNGIRIRL